MCEVIITEDQAIDFISSRIAYFIPNVNPMAITNAAASIVSFTRALGAEYMKPIEDQEPLPQDALVMTHPENLICVNCGHFALAQENDKVGP